MNLAQFIEQSLAESREYIDRTLQGLSDQDLVFHPAVHSNSIAFLLWHLARVEDLWISRVLLGGKEIYESEGWYKQFATPPQDSGFGYDVSKLKAWPVPKLELLKDYAGAVRTKTLAYLKKLDEKSLDEPKDFGWRKGTVGGALTHLVMEIGEHTGQIGYIKGIIKGLEPVPPQPRK
jgi:uncharacterized damage-inducible protein DinB